MRVLIADDHALFRETLQGLLAAQGIEVVGGARTGTEALALARCLKPDVVLMDLTMPEVDGLEATRKICRELKGIQVVILTASDEDEDLKEAMRCGAQGYLQKNIKAWDLAAFIRGLAEEVPTMAKSQV